MKDGLAIDNIGRGTAEHFIVFCIFCRRATHYRISDGFGWR